MSKTYTTRQGDTWDTIAYTQMGSCLYTKDIMWNNRSYLDLYTFPAGVVLTIPEASPLVTADMPPWKQVSA